MTEDLEQILSNLEMEQLKEVAQKHGIDCEECKEKEEYIIQISDSQKVTSEDVQSLFGMDTTTTSSPSEDSMPSFNDAEQLMQETKSIFDSGDYITTISKATEAIDCGSKALNGFYSKVLTYAIRSSENMISNLKDMEIDVSPIEEILGNAKASYDNQEFESTGAIISQLKDSVGELLSAHGQKISDLIESTQSIIDRAREMGADVVEAEKKLNDAKELHAKGSLPFAFDSVKESESLAEAANDNRIKDVQEIISRSGKIIEDAKYLHAPVSEAESLLETAQNAFDSEDYISAIENAEKASESANSARDEQIQRALSLQEKINVGEAATGGSVAQEPSGAGAEQETVSSEAEQKAKPSAKEEGMVCPKCEGEPSYVEQYDRYYCYTCSEYIEPVAKEEEKEEAKEEPAKEEAKVCPKCEEEASYVEQYDRYYCYTCSEYIEPVAKKKEEKLEEEKVDEEAEAKETAKVCPKCDSEASYVEQYDRYYCYTCSEYVEPVGKEEEEKPKEEVIQEEKEAAKVCPKCGGEPTYVEQYDRYYCYSCNEYIVPKGKEEEKAKEEEEKPKAAEKVCPKCEGEVTYVDQYQRYYCYTCNSYVEPKEKEPKKEATENVCLVCGQDATYVEQYQRYYCYTCNKYL